MMNESVNEWNGKAKIELRVTNEKNNKGDAWLAPSKEHATSDLRVMSLNLTLDVEIT